MVQCTVCLHVHSLVLSGSCHCLVHWSCFWTMAWTPALGPVAVTMVTFLLTLFYLDGAKADIHASYGLVVPKDSELARVATAVKGHKHVRPHADLAPACMRVHTNGCIQQACDYCTQFGCTKLIQVVGPDAGQLLCVIQLRHSKFGACSIRKNKT